MKKKKHIGNLRENKRKLKRSEGWVNGVGGRFNKWWLFFFNRKW